MADGSAQLVAVSFDANDPARLARFWSAALRWDVDDSAADIELVPTDGVSFRIRFRRVPDRKTMRNRIHFDLTTSSLDDQHATVARLLELGGSHVDVGQGPDETHVVLADPEGNELCIIEPTNSFLRECGRLGAINCDGSRATGLFWSEVLGRSLVWDQNEETAIRSPDPNGPMLTWSGPPLMPKPARNRLRLEIAGVDVERLVELGARRTSAGLLADPDDNEFTTGASRPVPGTGRDGDQQGG